MFKLVIFVTLCGHLSAVIVNQAIVNLKGTSNVKGFIKFTKIDGSVEIVGTVTGLTTGNHGFHIHEYGDVSHGCDALGLHFNPENKHHGGHNTDDRHVGDLGNIEADSNGVATFKILDTFVDLNGPHNIIGRGVAVYEKPDDLGLGNTLESLISGDDGKILACGVIGVSDY